MTDLGPVLELVNVSKRFLTPSGSVEVLHQVSLTIRPGDFVALTGPSGSGKSTLLYLSALLDFPTGGSVFFDGQEVSSLPEDALCRLRKQNVGMVFQQYYLLPYRTVLENVSFRFRYLDFSRLDTEKLSLGALDAVGLLEMANQPVRLLSGGEIQRVAVARAIALKPRLLIADEPTGNLDGNAAQAVMRCFQDLNQTGITIFMVTHNLSLLPFFSRHLSCRDGRITTEAR